MSLLYMVGIVAQAQGWQDDSRRNRPRHRDAPEFKVDADWPKTLPNQWLVGQVAGVAVDRHDRIWIIQRPRTLTEDEAGPAQTPRGELPLVPTWCPLMVNAAGFSHCTSEPPLARQGWSATRSGRWGRRSGSAPR